MYTCGTCSHGVERKERKLQREPTTHTDTHKTITHQQTLRQISSLRRSNETDGASFFTEKLAFLAQTEMSLSTEKRQQAADGAKRAAAETPPERS
jgi:hypothetical protein